LAHFEEKTAATLSKKEPGSLQFVVDLKALCILENLSLHMFLVALGFGLIQTLKRFYMTQVYHLKLFKKLLINSNKKKYYFV
jgi:hypothetical protein